MAAPDLSLVPSGPPPQRRQDAPPVEQFPEPSDPLSVAYALAEDRTTDKVSTLQHWRGSYWEYRATHWVEVEDKVARRWVYNRLRDVVYVKVREGEETEVPWKPDNAKVSNVLDAYSSACAFIEGSVETGTWLPTGARREGIVSTPDGLFDLNARRTFPHTPAWLCTWALPFSYDATAAEPTEWLRFLDSIKPVDGQATIDMIQEWLGYLLSGDTDQQKAMLLLGPTRCGKGTILKVAEALVGSANTDAPTLQNMTTQFGLENTIGKALISVGDARLSGNTTTLVERLLSMIAHENLTVDRKHRTPYYGRFNARMMIAANEMPDFRDPSGAIGGRFIIARFTESFLDREDKQLEQKLFAELPGIMRWALDGLDRLKRNGAFTQGEKAQAERAEMRESESPVAQFLDAACVVAEPHSIPKQVLYDVWNDWRERAGYAPTNVATFARMLRAAEPRIGSRRGGDSKQRVQLFEGVSVRESYAGRYGTPSEIRDGDTRLAVKEYVIADT